MKSCRTKRGELWSGLGGTGPGGEWQESRDVSDGDGLGIIPEINVLEDGGERIFDRSGAKEEAGEQAVLGNFVVGIHLAGICGIRIDDVSANLNIELAQAFVIVGGKSFGIESHECGTHAQGIRDGVVENLVVDGHHVHAPAFRIDGLVEELVDGAEQDAAGVDEGVVLDGAVVAAIPQRNAIGIVGKRVALNGGVHERPDEDGVEAANFGNGTEGLADGNGLGAGVDGLNRAPLTSGTAG